MKKVKLKALDLGASELLSREEQSIVFGSGGSGGSGSGGNGSGGSGGSGIDPCAGKSSVIYCKDSSGNILGEIHEIGCPTSGSGLDSKCDSYDGYDRTKSKCTC